MKVSDGLKAIAGLSLAFLLGLSAQASAAQAPIPMDVYQIPMHFTFDGKEYAPPEGQQGFIYEGTTYVPIRFISYSLDKSVSWDSATYTVSIGKPNASDTININEYKMNTQVHDKSDKPFDKSKLTPSHLHVYKEKVSYVFDGVSKSPSDDLPGYIVDGSLYVPIRFFSESVGKTIEWNPETYTVSANTLDEKKETDKKPSETTKPGTTAPVTGGGIVGGGGGGPSGGAVVKPSYESITAEAEAKLSSLQADATSSLSALYNEYKATHNTSLITQGLAKVAQIDSQFAQIMSETRTKLTANGYDTSIIATYTAQYNQMKADAQSALLGH
ncbi:copper amine oxidase N-terminal domain-containing protein [Paenibacillus roseipurpureus]|uniref:Copper amine oxidase N-terminal domain-containing protein n=1 Tax=Paenibacillus roseopurpureus TaxID=2918901 RepID=A0AA96RHQ9_9BACL|nr:copper amine oxidase N-terminal domain-containing protein [Paenibacillus sp. MBLB1832]WNR43503.1 copper amine oxidase N-terminal domain-containing protein [Paenibacillus sp. MBLB1832]